MADKPSEPMPTLPQVPKRDIWGRDLPQPNATATGLTSEDGEEIVESIGELAEANVEIFDELTTQFRRYTDSIKASNQNFLLKQGRLMLNNFRQAVIEGMIEGAEQNGTLDSKYLYDLMDDQGAKLEQLIVAQNEANRLEKEAQETAQEQRTEDKNAKSKETEAQKESWLRKFFTGAGDKDKASGLKKGKLADDDGILGALMDKIAFVIPAAKLLIPMLAGLSLFFVDFETLLKNPMWEKISKLIQEKLIPGAAYLFENVIVPLTNFLINNTLPAFVTGLINAFDDVVVLVQDIIEAFKAENWQEGLDKGVKALAKFLVNIGETLLQFVFEASGVDWEEFKKKLSKDWEDTKQKWADFFGPTITGWFNSLTDWIATTMDPEEQKRVAEESRKAWKARWEAFVGYWNAAVDGISKSWEYLKNIPNRFAEDWEATKQLWKDRWNAVVGAASSLLNGISERWTGLTNYAGELAGNLSDAWEASKAKMVGWKDGIISAFWGVVDGIRDSIVQVLGDLKDYFVALPGRIWDYVMNSIRAIPGADWILGEAGVEEPTQYIKPVRNVMTQDNAARTNADSGGAIGNMLTGMNKFATATDAFKQDARERDRSGGAPIIISPSTVNQSATTAYGGPSYMAPTRTGNDRSFFGAK